MMDVNTMSVQSATASTPKRNSQVIDGNTLDAVIQELQGGERKKRDIKKTPPVSQNRELIAGSSRDYDEGMLSYDPFNRPRLQEGASMYDFLQQDPEYQAAQKQQVLIPWKQFGITTDKKNASKYAGGPPEEIPLPREATEEAAREFYASLLVPSTTKVTSSDVSSAFGTWVRKFKESKPGDEETSSVMVLGKAPDTAVIMKLFCSSCLETVDEKDHECSCISSTRDEIGKFIIRALNTKDATMQLNSLIRKEQSFVVNTRKITMLMSSTTLIKFADETERLVFAGDLEWMTIKCSMMNNVETNRVRRRVEDLQKEFHVTNEELKQGWDSVTQIGAVYRKFETIIEDDEGEQVEREVLKYVTILNQKFQKPKWTTIRVITGPGISTLKKITGFLRVVQSWNDKPAKIGMDEEQFAEFCNTYRQSSRTMQGFLQSHKGSIRVQSGRIKDFIQAENFLKHGLWEPKFMIEHFGEKKQILGPGEISSYKEAINVENPCCLKGTSKLRDAILLHATVNDLETGGLKIRPFTFIIYSGEGDLDKLVYHPGYEGVVIDIVNLMSFRYLWDNVVMMMKRDMETDHELENSVNSTRFEMLCDGAWQNPKLSMAYLHLCKPPIADWRKMQGQLHDAAVDARMTLEIFHTCVDFQRKHQDVFDRFSNMEYTPEVFADLNQRLITDMGGPCGASFTKENKRRLFQRLRKEDMCDYCNHTGEDVSSRR